MPNRVDYTGRRFGRLTVVEEAGVRYSGFQPRRLYRCHCACGRDVVVEGSNLKSGNTKSCSCLRAEKARETMRANRWKGSSCGENE